MNSGSEHEVVSGQKSVQQYIDETPLWADGTALRTTPMTGMQWRIWTLAAAGKFFEGLVVFMTGVAMPLIADEFKITAAQHGVAGAASLFGILVGAVSLASLSDHFGRKRMFVIEMFIFMIFLCLIVVSLSYFWLVFFPVRDRRCSRLRLPNRSPDYLRKYPQQHARSTGAGRLRIPGARCANRYWVGYVILNNIPQIGAWRWMYATAIVPGLLVTLARFSITESAPWLFARGRVKMAEKQTARLLRREPSYPRIVTLAVGATRAAETAGQVRSYANLFTKDNRRATIFASVPWFLQDLGTYGIGIFTPTILAASVGHKTKYVRSLADLINNDILAARGAALIDTLLIVGIVCAILLSDRVGRIRLQILGFVGCAAGLFLASLSAFYTGSAHLPLIFLGFMLFNFMTNLGPNAQTYLLAGEVFPTRLRGMGAGFAAAFAKIGAVTTAFLFPILLVDIGTQALLYILVGTSLLGAVITWAFRIETTGISLETIGR
jgi:MFS family permease